MRPPTSLNFWGGLAMGTSATLSIAIVAFGVTERREPLPIRPEISSRSYLDSLPSIGGSSGPSPQPSSLTPTSSTEDPATSVRDQPVSQPLAPSGTPTRISFQSAVLSTMSDVRSTTRSSGSIPSSRSSQGRQSLPSRSSPSSPIQIPIQTQPTTQPTNQPVPTQPTPSEPVPLPPSLPAPVPSTSSPPPTTDDEPPTETPDPNDPDGGSGKHGRDCNHHGKGKPPHCR